VAAAAVAAVAGGCGGERALVAEVRGAEGADRLCLLASAGGRVVFARGYGEDGSPPPPAGTLAFVAGDVVATRLSLTARAMRGGAVLARASAEAAFPASGEVVVPLPLARCVRRSAPARALTVREGVRVEAVATAATLGAADTDGDGRDEALVLGAGGTLVRVDPVARRVDALAATGVAGRIEAIGDLDGDCALDAVVLGADGVRVLRGLGPSAAADPPIGGTLGAVDAALGAVSGGVRIAVASPGGATLVAARGATGAVALDTRATVSVEVGDLTGDGRADVVSSGEGGVRVWIATDAGPMTPAGALPASSADLTGPVVLLDADGDGALDVLGAGPGGLRLALNRGDGLLEDRTGAPPRIDGVRRLVAADFDGDCKDDVALIDEAGTLEVWRVGLDWARLLASPLPGVADVRAADVDGDGAPELLVLTTDALVRVVSP
jgi:hypothetical protein